MLVYTPHRAVSSTMPVTLGVKQAEQLAAPHVQLYESVSIFGLAPGFAGLADPELHKLELGPLVKAFGEP